MTSNPQENFETFYTIANKLKFLAKSEIRLQILDCLKEKEFTISEISKKTGLRYSSVSSNISKLELNNYIKRIKNKYTINNITLLYLNHVLELRNTIKIIKKFDEFWSKHKINEINDKLLNSLNDLYKATLIESSPIEIYKIHNITKEQILESKNIKAVFPFLHPEYPEILTRLLKDDAEVELIISDKIYNDLVHNIEKELRKKETFKVQSTLDSLDIYLVIGENFMNLGLFKTDGSFDQNRLLTSNNPKAIKWGNTLFESIKSSKRGCFN